MRVAKAYQWDCPGCGGTKTPQVRHQCSKAPLPGSNELVQWWRDPDSKPEVLVSAQHGKPNLAGHVASHKGDGVTCPQWEHHHCSEVCEVEEVPVPDSDAWKTIPANKITMAGGIIYPLSGTIKFDLLTADDSESQAKQKLTKQMKQAQPVKDVPAHEKLAGQILTIAKSHGVPISEFVALEIARAAEKLFGSSSEEMQKELDQLQHTVDILTTNNLALIQKVKSVQQALHEKKTASFYQVPQPNTWTNPVIGTAWHANTTSVTVYDDPPISNFSISPFTNDTVMSHQASPTIAVKGVQIHLTAVETIHLSPVKATTKWYDAAMEKAKHTVLAKLQMEATAKELAILTTPMISVWSDDMNDEVKVQAAVLCIEQVAYPMKEQYGSH